MTCSTTQDDLGPLFADVDDDLAAAFIAQATLIVLGPEAGQATKEAAYTLCGVDPCNMIVLLSQHLLTITPGAGATSSQTIESKTVGSISVSYGTAASSSGLFAGSPYGTLFALNLSRFEQCRARRRSFPRSVGSSRATNS
jgi:outer membrane protein assembly factor BamB